ncbi:hypothetical protein BMF94_6557 [Rhodotorula taiwanensis]|uniref:Uncharacterized protein n=1 Tax=Rhodotorula taiwanensis TaxID=741276 RepID=A0A2S5B132_9BASI|nr:hypothetical protein BMF94_6557 [Rhodotorula taiwanensis]
MAAAVAMSRSASMASEITSPSVSFRDVASPLTVSRRASQISFAPSSRPSSFAGRSGRVRSIRSISEVAELSADLIALAQTHRRQYLMAEHIFRRCEAAGWFPDANWGNIVAVRASVGTAGTSTYASYPLAHEVDGADVLLDGLATINAEAAVIVSSHVVRSILQMIDDNTERVVLNEDVAIQVIDSLEDLRGAKRHQYAAFVRENLALVLWSDDVATLIPHAQTLSDLMLSYIWREQDDTETEEEKDIDQVPQVAVLTGEADPEAAEIAGYKRRPVGLLSPLHVGLAVGINILVQLLTLETIIREFLEDGYWPRFFIALAIPFQFCVSQFFCVVVIAIILQLLGPVKQMHQNNRYYSGERPPRMRGPLPSVTVLMPVYKEGLDTVLLPTIRSLQDAIKTYELQGGSVNIMVCDDGMQLLNEKDYLVRKAFYEANAIGYVARPGHGKYYKRAGRFKKSSNLNVALELSIRVEEMLKERRPERSVDNPWTYEEDQVLYEKCLQDALEEKKRVFPAEKDDEKPKIVGPWASGHIRMGELILIIDSDTRVPVDCFLDAASEMHHSPECSIIQHVSDVMIVEGNFFENGIAFFTRLVNTSISWVCSNGDVGCFVGHNAFIRWSALQEIAQWKEDEKRWQIWSESHVSEDFDCAMRMLVAGYDVRWATYSNGGFQEGVSLSADDEINRWQKYAFGVSELLLHRLKDWPFKGPLTPMAKDFFWKSNLPLHYKLSSFSYMMSYYGISVAFPLSVAGYILYGMFIPSLDNAYMPSWKVTVALMLVFGCASAFAFAVLRYRSGQCGLHTALLEQAKWTPFNTLFFAGLSLHVLTALLAHPVGYDMTWAATVKESTNRTIFTEVPAIMKRFRLCFIVCSMCIAMIVVFAFLPLMEWQIIDWVSIVPLALVVGGHILYPFLLNPAIMSLRF